MPKKNVIKSDYFKRYYAIKYIDAQIGRLEKLIIIDNRRLYHLKEARRALQERLNKRRRL